MTVSPASLHSSGGPSEARRQSLVYENILENLLDGVMSVGLDGHVLTFNSAAARMLGRPRDEVVGHTLMEAFFAVDGFDDFNQAILDAVTERDRTERQVVEVTVGGELRSFSMTTSYLTSPDAGEPVGVIAVFSDITEVQALQQAERLMARALEEQNAELKESYRSAEEHRERLDTVLKRVQVARGIATVLVIGLFLGAGLWSWGGFDPSAIFDTGASPAQAGEGEAGPLRTVVLEPGEFASPTLLVGRLVPSREVPVTSAADGHVGDIRFAYGRRVSQGETLLRLDMDETRLERLDAWAQYEDAKKTLEDLDNWESGAEVASAQRAFTKARIAMEGEAAALKRSEFLAKEGLIPASQHEDARRRFRNQQLDFEAARHDLDAIRAKSGGKARQVAEVKLQRAQNKLRAIEASLDRDTIKAPISGVVSVPPGAEETRLAVGRSVAKGDTLLVISDVDRMAVVAPVDEVEVVSIRPGQPVTVRGDAFPGLEMRGTVSHVSPEPSASKPGERLCCRSSCFPRGSVSEDSVEDCEELSCDGGEGSLFGFSLRDQVAIEAFEGWVMPGGGEGSHVEGCADVGASSPYGSLSAHGSAVAVEGRDADERGDAPSAEGSEFGEIGDQGSCGGVTDPGNAFEEVLGLAPCGGFADRIAELGFEVGEFALQGGEHAVDAADRATACEAPPAVSLRGHHRDDLAPPGDQLGERAGLLVRHRTGLGMDRLGELCDRRRIEGVGLGEPAGGAGEVPDLARVDHRQWQARRAERRRDRDLEAARRLQHHEGNLQPAQARRQLFQAFAVARDGKGLPGRAQMHVQTILRHVDANEYPFHVPSLQMRSHTADQATVRVQRNSGRGTMLSRGLHNLGASGLPSAPAVATIAATTIRRDTRRPGSRCG